MQVHTLDKAGIINELQFGRGISHAVEQGRRADFSLLLAMFSADVRDNTPVEQVEQPLTSDDILRKRFALQNPQALRNDQSSYAISARQADMFHHGGLASAKLAHYLQPEVLTYLPEDTQDLPEDVYLNLSGHERRHLAQKTAPSLIPADLYPQLNTAWRQDQIHAQV
ncbi:MULTISPECIES: VC2046/SO_2500 family protein [Vibrio]|uniref:Queuosine biosynthesis protein QueD n=1 Tax=Vibrio ostreae TaxID=2841925 RepID=A0A975UAE2_9VIBR|nr:MULTISPECIES: VC2046/SO_2500 family protein [Vibrio]QXO18174.1 hypothetical protein KNV97_07750 [Vibrio ostreae]WGY47503.1 hypothetical protein J0X00_07515 [Vibrio sp. ABG19]